MTLRPGSCRVGRSLRAASHVTHAVLTNAATQERRGRTGRRTARTACSRCRGGQRTSGRPRSLPSHRGDQRRYRCGAPETLPARRPVGRHGCGWDWTGNPIGRACQTCDRSMMQWYSAAEHGRSVNISQSLQHTTNLCTGSRSCTTPCNVLQSRGGYGGVAKGCVPFSGVRRQDVHCGPTRLRRSAPQCPAYSPSARRDLALPGGACGEPGRDAGAVRYQTGRVTSRDTQYGFAPANSADGPARG